VNRRTITIVGLVVGTALILALYGLIGRGIVSERQQQADLSMQIEPLEAALDNQQGGAGMLPTRRAELATLQAELAAVQFAFPSEMDSTAVLDFIFTAINNNGIAYRRVEDVSEPITSTIGDSDYAVFLYNVEVEGGLNSLSTFLADLESGPISTLVLDQIRLEAQPTPEVYRMSLVVQVYVRLRR
jgi:Tfp pilus assembly protein PilO